MAIGRVTGSRADASSQQVVSTEGFDPARKLGRPLRSLGHEELVHECCYRGAELVIERTRTMLSERQLRRRLLAAWTDFLDANPDDVTSPEEYPDHALVTFEQMLSMVALAIQAEGSE